MTVSEGQQSSPVDLLASQRTELLGRVAGAQIELERLMASLRAAATPIPADIIAQQGDLAALIRDIATARPADLATLQATVASAVTNVATAAAQQSQSAQGDRTAALADAAEASRKAVQSALDYTSSLDLQFKSAEDERAYREREATRRAYIEAEQAKHTPQGDLNASNATIGQMADAKAHGASGPEFDKQWNTLVVSNEQLREATRANGISTQESDNRLRDDLRRVMKAKGLSDAQINAQFAANPDPLDAAKAYAQGDTAELRQGSAPRTAVTTAVTSDKELDEMASLVASLQSSGVVARPLDRAAEPTHGVTAAAPATSTRSV